jgi:precorrin-3B C17-methyltransferase
VFEAMEQGDASGREIDVEVIPGVSAMQAAAARVGAPLGGDFCAISLSDNLKSWETISRRLEHAAKGDFVIALYNPASRARPTRIHDAFALLRNLLSPQTPVVFAKSVWRAGEEIIVTNVGDADPSCVDMSTLVIVGSTGTRLVARGAKSPLVYTLRRAP